MASLPLSVENFKVLKQAVAKDLDNVPKSGHLDEALARALRYRTYAAFLADVRSGEHANRARLLSESVFEDYLLPHCPEFGDDPFWWPGFDALDTPVIIKTVPISAYEIEYKSRRNKAWRNVMVAAINAALEQRKFGLRPHEDFEVPDRSVSTKEVGRLGFYEFTLAGLPVLAFVQEAGFDELSIYAMVNPTKKARRDILWEHNDASAGAVWARCWFERRTGAWMQNSSGYFRCQRPYLDLLANLDIEPEGFGDRGRIMM